MAPAPPALWSPRLIIALDARPLMTRKGGGAEQHARNIVAQWAAMALPHQFLLLCDRRHTDEVKYDPSFVAALPPNFHQTMGRGFTPALRWYLGSRVLDSLTRSLAHNNVAVYHSFTPAAPRIATCPVVQTIHDLSFELDPAVRERPESRSLRRLVRQGALRAQRIVAVSTQTKNDIASLYGVPEERISVVYNGINPVFTAHGDPEFRQELRARHRIDCPYVIAVGSDIPRRNYARMLNAMISVWKTNPRLRLLLAGQNDWRGTPVFRQAETAGVRDRIIFVQGPTDAELAQLYRDAVLTCCASSFEGFGMSVLESMACGTPVTCSDMRSLHEVADDAALYFPHDDPETMGESIGGLLEDVEYRRQLKYRGLARAEKFTWATAARLVLAILEDVGESTRNR